MKQRRLSVLAIFITLLMLAATYVTWPILQSRMYSGSPKAIQGALDLSAWRFPEQGTVRLDGDWEFYPGRLLRPADFSAASISALPIPTNPASDLPLTAAPASAAPQDPKTFLSVPGSWTSVTDAMTESTYRLKLNVSHSAGIYGLYALSVQMSSRIYVNGLEIGASGEPGNGSKANYHGQNKPIVGYFPLEDGWNEVIVQAANYDFPASSGINQPIYLGTQQQIADLHNRALAHDWIAVTAFLLMGVYFIGLFSQRRKDGFLLIFGLLCLCIAAFSTMREERILYEWFPGMPAWLYLRIQIISALSAGVCIYLYVRSAFSAFCSARFVRLMISLGFLLILLNACFFQFIYAHNLLLPLSIYVSFSFVYAMNVLITAALHRTEGSLYLAIAALALNVYAYVQNLNVYFAVPVFIFPPVEPFVFLIMISLLMSLRFSNAFKQNERMSLELIKADALKDQFLTRTAHEFKTPLHGMIHMADSLHSDRDHPLTPGQQDKLRLISAAASRLSSLVHDIMDLSKMKQGELSIRLVPLDIRSSVQAVLDMFVYIVDERGIQLVNRIPADLPLGTADENRFQQIVSNLLDNACKHSAGRIVEVAAATADGQLEVSVKDTGEGIGEEELAYIFEPFVTSNPDSGENFGLGMPIVKQLVELQNGRIRVSSVRGQGTTVTFTLPIYSADLRSAGDSTQEVAASSEPANRFIRPDKEEYTFPTPYVSPRQNARMVIVVDDSLSNLKVMVDILERLEFTVIALASGEQSLQRLREGGTIPDLVVLDLMMPGMNGFELCREIRRSFSLFELPVLMVTAAFRTEEKLAAFDAGANDFLIKPFDAAELQARVKGLIELKTSVGKAIGMEAAFLQSQIKPHFLYNVLNTIMSLSYSDPEKSREIVSHLADYLRGSFSFRDMQRAAPFSKELELIRHYVDIEAERFKERLQVEYEVEEAVLPVKLPPLLIQPLVENAIRHGIGSRKGGGRVRIRAFREGQDAVFEICDDGVGMTPEQLAAATAVADEPPAQPGGRISVGLQNIRKRLRYTYGAELRVRSQAGEGTTVTVKVPLEAASGSQERKLPS